MPKIVKLTWPSDWPLLRQTPNHAGLWGGYQFIIDNELKECDFWVVYENLLQEEEVKCPKNNTLLITAEPKPVKTYLPKFLNQFRYVITSQVDVNHVGKVLNQQALAWHVGRSQKDHVDISFSKDYDELASLNNFKKTKLVSVISSNKKITPEHSKRVAFINLLKHELGGDVDFFGRGFNEIEDKWDAIAPYKYHIVLENSSYEHYWTEKLADSYLGGAFPIYYGAPNIDAYFPEGSYKIIDINDPKQAIEKIKRIIKSSTYEESKTSLEVSKDLILNQYNLFPFVASFINGLDLQNGKKVKHRLQPLSHFSRKILTMHNLRVQVKKLLQLVRIVK